jgi:hypothetical protein
VPPPPGPSVLPPPKQPTTTASKTNIPQNTPEAPVPTINPLAAVARRGLVSQFDVSGALSDLGRAAVEGVASGVRQRVQTLVGGGSEPPTGDAPVPGLVGPSSVGGTEACPPGTFRMPGGSCVRVDPTAVLPGGRPFVSTVDAYGAATVGHFGVALVPSAMTQTRLRCPRGMVLGADDLCYNRRDLRKDERKWIPGRKPLLTGGDLNAISRAARAASRVKTQQKRLESLGLLKKPTRRAPARKS